ncbi:MAG TPA: hypothetical protein VFA45_23965 [Actinomycetes bacterium]|nr:hypothetical protein [Actinomycetes bacterium]
MVGELLEEGLVVESGAEAILDRAGISVEAADEEAALVALLTAPAARPVLDETAR